MPRCGACARLRRLRAGPCPTRHTHFHTLKTPSSAGDVMILARGVEGAQSPGLRRPSVRPGRMSGQIVRGLSLAGRRGSERTGGGHPSRRQEGSRPRRHASFEARHVSWPSGIPAAWPSAGADGRHTAGTHAEGVRHHSRIPDGRLNKSLDSFGLHAVLLAVSRRRLRGDGRWSLRGPWTRGSSAREIWHTRAGLGRVSTRGSGSSHARLRPASACNRGVSAFGRPRRTYIQSF